MLRYPTRTARNTQQLNCDENNMPISPDACFDHYEIVAPLGAGGMGEVYRARDIRLHREVALKILPAEFAQDTDRLRRFELEAKATSALNHPNILTVYDFGTYEGAPYIVAEMLEGEPLRALLQRGALPLPRALDCAQQIAQGLMAAHAKGIIHRDLKPENVFVTKDGRVKILDFGLAKLTEKVKRRSSEAGRRGEDQSTLAFSSPLPQAPAPPHGTNPGTVMGTASYMSPEQARGHEVDARSDIFSLGILLYEMLTGRAPFDGISTSDVIGAILHLEHRPLAKSLHTVPPELEWIVAKTLAKDCEERYQTIKSVHSDLRRLRRRLDFEKELERSKHPDLADPTDGAETTGQFLLPTTGTRTAFASSPQNVSGTSSAEYLVTEIKRHRSTLLLALLAFLLVGAGIVYVLNRSRSLDSLAVMPLTNTGSNVNLEYFSDDLTNGLIRNLLQLPNLEVRPFSSILRYKGKETDPTVVASALKVKSILVIRLIPRGEGVSVKAELVETDNDRVLWSEQYEKGLADVALIKEDISHGIVEKLRPRLSDAERNRMELNRLYETGRNFWNKRDVDGLNKAIAVFNQIVEKDALYAPAYAGLADCYLLLTYYGSGTSHQENYTKAKEFALKALELNESLAEAHTSLAQIHFEFDRQMAEAEKEFKRAIELNPNYATAYQWYAEFLTAQGHFEDAIFRMKRAEEIDPLSPIIKADLGTTYNTARDYDRALQQYQRALQLNPNFAAAYWWMGETYTMKGQFAEAIASLKKALDLSGRNTRMMADLAFTHAKAGNPTEARKLLDQIQTIAKQSYVSPYELALVYIGLGEKDQAFSELNRAFDARPSDLLYLNVEPFIDGLRSDPRFTPLIRRVGLVP